MMLRAQIISYFVAYRRISDIFFETGFPGLGGSVALLLREKQSFSSLAIYATCKVL